MAGDPLSVNITLVEKATNIDMRIARMLPENMARRFRLVVIGELDNSVVVAMADPLDVIAQDTIRGKLGREIKVAPCPEQAIQNAIEAIYHGSDIEEQQLRNLVEHESDTWEQDMESEDVLEASISDEEAATQAPVVDFVSLLLSQAVKNRASDIHVEPQERSTIVRLRVDGALHKTVSPPRRMQSAVISRIKLLSGMNIAERRLPQDGRLKTIVGNKEIDVRVSAIPTRYGEKIVMRILDASATNHDIDQLGFEPELLEAFKSTLSQPHGIVIVTGPTGSGKSTTLYSALNFLRDESKNIMTVEDPIEYSLAEINQIQIKPGIGLNFGPCLRAILRQDPDIIMVGEIRDKETAEIAIEASLTGHLVLSTLHTNDAPSVISRFGHLGIDPYLLASSLNLVIAQRLVMKICDYCKEKTNLESEVLEELKITAPNNTNIVFWQGNGCSNCGRTGYLGRLPIFEFLVIDDEIRELLMAGANESQIRKISRQKGYGGLLESGLGRMLLGLTTAEEVLHATLTEKATTGKLKSDPF